MALLNILIFPDPRLKKVATPVLEITAEIKQIATDMLETMYDAGGIGLAATQVNIQQRIVVLDISENNQSPLCLINPVITSQDGEITWEDGCLSLPGVYAKVKRAATINLEYTDLDGNLQSLVANELLSVCLQHEIDHLNGITFYDRLSKLKQTLLKKKLKNMVCD